MKCKLCKTYFKPPSFKLEKEGEGKCFSCRYFDSFLRATATEIALNSAGCKKSKDYWTGQINNILNKTT